MNSEVNVQIFRKKGIIICIKIGYIAVDIPRHWKVRNAEYVGTSSYGNNSYYDIRLNDFVYLHIAKWGKCDTPFFFKEYPL